jgi:hypothetical protein
MAICHHLQREVDRSRGPAITVREYKGKRSVGHDERFDAGIVRMARRDLRSKGKKGKRAGHAAALQRKRQIRSRDLTGTHAYFFII